MRTNSSLINILPCIKNDLLTHGIFPEIHPKTHQKLTEYTPARSIFLVVPSYLVHLTMDCNDRKTHQENTENDSIMNFGEGGFRLDIGQN